jgi:release factor glutamine methyltransferase
MQMPEIELGTTQCAHTVASALRQFGGELRLAGIAEAAGDMRRLVGAALHLSSADLLREPERALSDAEVLMLRGYVERRKRREPVSRILGRRDFYGRTFVISAATLDPRPESETLITAALELIREEAWQSHPLRLLDVGTGSGCLLLTLLCELANATGVGSDISASALETARENAVRLGLAHRASWLQADALEPVAGPFHMLVANPPYIRTGEIAGLEPEVRDFDPVQALDGGFDGLAIYRRLLPEVPRLAPQGWVVLEVGHDQAEAVSGLLANQPGIDGERIRIRYDVAGKRRCVAARTLS